MSKSQRVLSFRLEEPEVAVWEQLRAVTEDGTWIAAHRLLMNDPAIKRRIGMLARGDQRKFEIRITE